MVFINPIELQQFYQCSRWGSVVPPVSKITCLIPMNKFTYLIERALQTWISWLLVEDMIVSYLGGLNFIMNLSERNWKNRRNTVEQALATITAFEDRKRRPWAKCSNSFRSDHLISARSAANNGDLSSTGESSCILSAAWLGKEMVLFRESSRTKPCWHLDFSQWVCMMSDNVSSSIPVR